MFAYTSRLQLSEQTLLDAFRMALEHAGTIALPAAFQTVSDAENPPTGAEAARTGPNKVCEADRTVSGVANVFSVSRSGIRLHIDGLEVEHYNQCNPVVLAGHCSVSSDLMPGAIGQIEKVYKASSGTELRFRNMRFDTDPLAEAWYQKVLKGFVRMVSVGFIPIEWGLEHETVGKGKDKKEIAFIDIPKAELLEISVVPIGANRGALFGQAPYLALLERVNAAEQRAVELQQAITAFLKTERDTAAQAARDRLLAALDQFPKT